MKGNSPISGAWSGLGLAALLGLLTVPCLAASAPPAPLPVLGIDPLTRGSILEYHQDALSLWVARGVGNAVLVHIDANGGMSAVQPEKLSTLKDLVSRRDIDALTRGGRSGSGGLFNEGNFVRAAGELGVVREVLWIIPFTVPTGEDAEKTMKDFLGRAGFPSRDSGTFRLADGCYRGRIGETAVRLCGQEHLPEIPDPVLLSIDADFFVSAAAWRGINPLSEIRALFTALRAARYTVAEAMTAFAVQEGDLPPDLRWIGEAVAQILQDPLVVQAETPPERLSALQKLSTLGQSGQRQRIEMLGFALANLETRPHDPAFLLYAAVAADQHGGIERALAYAEEACRMDRGYCVGLREVGLRFLERGDIETGLSFVAAGEKLLPGMEYGQLDLGIALMKAGKAAEALAALEKERGRNGAYPSGFLMGFIHLHLGDRAAARLSFDAALTAIGELTDIRVDPGEIAQVIAAAAAYYREEGLKELAERLEGDPRLRLPAPRAEPEQTGGK
ncbi:MAG: hypothetical protein ACYC9Y_02695 [Candidatus Methylomirabilia bacterium]